MVSFFSFLFRREVEERSHTLEKIRGDVKGFNNSTLSIELCTLIDRELEMLRRGRPPGAVVGLRKRISMAFQHLIQQCSAQNA